jgi:long-chain acyl-CoA synthetase
VTAEKIMAHCRERLTSYKLPKTIEFIDELPKTPVGKILRRELKELVLARDLVETAIKKQTVETIPG